MKDYFYKSYPRSKLNNSKSQAEINNINRPSLFNLSGTNIVYNGNNKKNSITSQLKNNNILAHKQLDEINEEYNNMRNILNNKISKLEKEQQMQFESLRNYLEEKNELENMKYKEQYKKGILNEMNNEMDYEYDKRKKKNDIINIDYNEQLGKRKAKEEKERKKFMEDMEYFKKIQYINQMEKILLQKNRMQKRIFDMYQNRYFPFYMNNINPYISPILLDLFYRNDDEHKQKELMKLLLLKNIMDSDNPKKARPFFARPPKYFIQKYYPPNAEPKIIQVPQPVFFQAPEPPTPKYPPIIIPRDRELNPRINVYTREERRRRKTEKRHKHKHKHKHKHRSPHKTGSTKYKKTETEEKEETEKSDEEDNEEKEEKEEKEESSSEPEVRLKLHDPDNPDDDRIVYPVSNPT